jgi:DNA-binding response OmpR family regulator
MAAMPALSSPLALVVLGPSCRNCSVRMVGALHEVGFSSVCVRGIQQAEAACSLKRFDAALVATSFFREPGGDVGSDERDERLGGLLDRLADDGTPVVVTSRGPEAVAFGGHRAVASVLTGYCATAEVAGALRLACLGQGSTAPGRSRPEPGPPSPSAMGSVLLDLARGVVSLEGRSVELTAKELAALTLLVAEQGKLVTTEALLEHVWPSPTTATKSDVYALVYRVRRRTGDLHRKPPLIRSRRGLGYLVDPEVMRSLIPKRGGGVMGLGFSGSA